MKNKFTTSEQKLLLENCFVKKSDFIFEFRPDFKNHNYGLILTKDKNDGCFIKNNEIIIFDIELNPRVEKYEIPVRDEDIIHSLEYIIKDLFVIVEL